MGAEIADGELEHIVERALDYGAVGGGEGRRDVPGDVFVAGVGAFGGDAVPAELGDYDFIWVGNEEFDYIGEELCEWHSWDGGVREVEDVWDGGFAADYVM